MLTLDRDHMKDVHHLSQERCDREFNFKSSQFLNLKTLYLKWKEGYRRLYPQVPEDQIPSPYVDDDDAKADSASIMDAKVKEEVDARFNLIAKGFPPEIQRQIRKQLDEIRTDFRGSQNFSEDTTNDHSPVDAALRPHQGQSPFVASPGFPTPSTSSQSPLRTTLDEGFYESSPLLKDEGLNVIGPAMFMQTATYCQNPYDMDPKPAFANEIKIENDLPPLCGPTVFMDHAAPRNPSNQFNTPQFGADMPVYYTNAVSAPHDYRGYTQPNENIYPSFTPNPTFGDPILYPNFNETATNTSSTNDVVWGPPLGSGETQYERSDRLQAYNCDLRTSFADKEATLPPSSYIEDRDSFLNDFFDFDLARYDAQ
jgi:hypothetical protein